MENGVDLSIVEHFWKIDPCVVDAIHSDSTGERRESQNQIFVAQEKFINEY